ncbi:MAG TPA: ABC transporter [Rhodospirillaceae bacterium]|nr:ABC transporter [Rhodospirillaceae bacterium]
MTIETRALATGYPGYPVGRDMNLTVRGGRVTALLGPNGCGKTTLFRTLLGLLKPQGGQVLIDGDDLAGLPRGEVAKRVAYVPQVVEGYFPFSVMDVVLMGRAPHLGMFAAPGAGDRRVAGEALAELRIADLAGRSFTAISGGQRQLVLIARALAQEAPVIFMDEPTASLDFANQFHVLDCISRLSHAGRTIVISSHHPDHALRFADDAVLMETGGLFAAGTTGEILSSETLSRVYGMEIVIAEVAAGRGSTTYRVCVPNPVGGAVAP